MLLDLLHRLNRGCRWSLALGLGLGGCSAPVDAYGPADGDLEALVAAHCDAVASCQCGADLVADSCPEDLTARWQERRAEGERRRLQYDAACLEALAAQLVDRPCQPAHNAADPLCGSFCAVFHGDRALGESCEAFDPHASDCEQGLVCHQGTCAEPCAVLVGRQRGEPCWAAQFNPYDDCAADLYCSLQTGNCELATAEGEYCRDHQCAQGFWCIDQHCEAVPTEGQPCPYGHCADGLYCGPGPDFADVCHPFLSEGSPCIGNYHCGPERWCTDAGVCQGPPSAGEPCLFGWMCSDGLLCGQGERCMVAPGEGQACIDQTCAAGLWCDTAEEVDGICTAPRDNHEACRGHLHCASGYCPAGYCLSRPREGEDCTGAQVCANGLVCNTSTCEPTTTRAPAACAYPGW